MVRKGNQRIRVNFWIIPELYKVVRDRHTQIGMATMKDFWVHAGIEYLQRQGIDIKEAIDSTDTLTKQWLRNFYVSLTPPERIKLKAVIDELRIMNPIVVEVPL